MQEIVSLDIGGTHARFALAVVEDGRVHSLGDPCILKTAEHASLETAWDEFARRLGRKLPAAAAIAIAGPVKGELLKLTNSHWYIVPADLDRRLGLDRHILVNDFGAVAHAVAQLGREHFDHVSGPRAEIPDEGIITIVGPGTGLGVAQLLRWQGGYRAVETEGGHMDFAPLDSFEDGLLAQLRERHRRVSVERIVSGSGLTAIYEALAALEGKAVRFHDEKSLWTAAIAADDKLAVAALDRFCLSLGSVAGDLALVHGANAVVIAGGLGARLAGHLPRSGFHHRFVAKGRFEAHMEAMPVKLIVHPEPGLYGAAAAFAQRFGG